jgi:hypothetical protein
LAISRSLRAAVSGVGIGRPVANFMRFTQPIRPDIGAALPTGLTHKPVLDIGKLDIIFG